MMAGTGGQRKQVVKEPVQTDVTRVYRPCSVCGITSFLRFDPPRGEIYERYESLNGVLPRSRDVCSPDCFFFGTLKNIEQIMTSAVRSANRAKKSGEGDGTLPKTIESNHKTQRKELEKLRVDIGADEDFDVSDLLIYGGDQTLAEFAGKNAIGWDKPRSNPTGEHMKRLSFKKIAAPGGGGGEMPLPGKDEMTTLSTTIFPMAGSIEPVEKQLKLSEVVDFINKQFPRTEPAGHRSYLTLELPSSGRTLMIYRYTAPAKDHTPARNPRCPMDVYDSNVIYLNFPAEQAAAAAPAAPLIQAVSGKKRKHSAAAAVTDPAITLAGSAPSLPVTSATSNGTHGIIASAPASG